MKSHHPLSRLAAPLLALAVIACLATPQALGQGGQRHALVIGNGAYQTARTLPNAPNDARDVAAALAAAGWRVTKAQDTGIKDLLRTLREFCETAQGAESALFFYAGHGVEVNGKNYLLPVDAALDEVDGEDALPLETLSVEKVLADLGAARIPLKTVVLDCCRDNPLQRSWLASRSSGGGGLAEMKEDQLPEGTMLVYSTAPGKTAADGRGTNSPFTAALLSRMKAGGGGVADVFGDVAVAMGRGQEAWIRFDGSGRSFAAFRAYPLLPGAVPTGVPAAPSPVMLTAADRLLAATKDAPFVNSLGMKFVPVVKYQDGKQVLFSIWETRVQDYATYAAKNAGVDGDWKDYEYEGHQQGPEHPVVNVSDYDAKAFCAWLTQSERATGNLGPWDEYRLPTDGEWSYAVGIGNKEDAQATPEEKDAKVEGVYPWGTVWPPPAASGNFAGAEAKTAFDFPSIDGYWDAHAFTAPVGSYVANRLGIYDLGGNVWEWCEDWYKPISGIARVVRGAAWNNNTEIAFRSSCRYHHPPANRRDDVGFRVVVASGVGGKASVAD